MTPPGERRIASDPDHDAGPARRRPELWLFAGMAAFGLILGTVYWFVTYEPAGTILLGGFGVASAVAAALTALHPPPLAGPESAPGVEDGGHSLAGWGPFVGGIGLGMIGLGLILGPVLAIPGMLIAIAGGRAWLSAVDRHDDR